ncbi:MAG: hypothetical protein D6747_02245 [Chlorobiota bacterium]|nr:MAG: hypothetical protein D6747_02245 [Chlorobiota bacterium]
MLTIAVLVSVTIGGCTSSSSTGDGGNSMSAIVGSQQWTAAPGMVQASNSNGVIAIAGMDASATVQIQLRVVGVSQPGTVQIGVGYPHAATLSDRNMIYTASAVAGSGTITFSKLTSTEAEGTFSFVGINTQSKLEQNVTNGKFSVRFK